MALKFSSSLPGEESLRNPVGRGDGHYYHESHMGHGTGDSLRDDLHTAPVEDRSLVFSRDIEDGTKDESHVNVGPVTSSSTFGQHAANSIRHHVTRGFLAALIVIGFCLGKVP